MSIGTQTVFENEEEYLYVLRYVLDTGDEVQTGATVDGKPVKAISRIDGIQRSPADYPHGKAGQVIVVQFTLAGQGFMAPRALTRGAPGRLTARRR